MGINSCRPCPLYPFSLEGVRFKDLVMSEKNWGHGAQSSGPIFFLCFV